MQEFKQRVSEVDGKPVYDFRMPANGDPYGGSHVNDGTADHKQLTHSKVLIWPADDPSKSAHVTIVWGNGAGSVELDTGPSTEWTVPAAGLVSVESDDKRLLSVFGDVFGVWGG